MNIVIVQFKNEGKESTSLHPGHPQPTERILCAVKRSVEQNPRTTAADVAKRVEKNSRTVVRYLHALGYHGRAARRKPLLRPFNIEHRISNGDQRWQASLWSFGIPSSSLMSPALHSFLTVVESGSGGFHPKSFLCGICSQQSSFQIWSGVPFGQLDILSLWSATETSMLKNTSAFWIKDCCLHSIDENCVIVPPFSCKMELLAILQKRQRIGWQKKK